MNMPQQDPLANLRDIHTPPAIDFWPLAPGWWLLAALCISFIIFSIYLIRKHRNKTAFKRAAQQQLQNLKKTKLDNAQYLQELNRLLKQTALAANSRQDIAKLNGDDWLHFLDQHSNDQQQAFSLGAGKILALGPYQATPSVVDREQLNQLVAKWIKQQRIKRPVS